MSSVLTEREVALLQVIFCREGDEAAQRLPEWLIDEPVHDATAHSKPANEAAALGFDGWLAYMHDRVLHAMGRGG